MSRSYNQNLSIHSYGGSVEVGSFTVSTYDSVINAIETYLGENEGLARPHDQLDLRADEADSRPVVEALVMEAGTSG